MEPTQPKFIKLISGIGIFAVVALGATVALQQKMIREIQTTLATYSQPYNAGGDNVSKNSDAISKEIIGKITRISAGEMTVEARVLDVGKLASLQGLAPEPLPTVSKTYVIGLTPGTKFASVVSPVGAATLSEKDFRQGDEVRIITGESIFQNDRVTAVSVTYVGGRQVPLSATVSAAPQQAPGRNSYQIAGTIAGIKEESIGVKVVTGEEIAIRRAYVSAQTRFVERVLKPSSEIALLMEQYDKDIAANPGKDIPFPKTYTSERVITKQDLKVGNKVTVFVTQTNGQIVADIVARIVNP